jgi:putative membrane protein
VIRPFGRFGPGCPGHDGLFWVHDLFGLLIVVAVVVGVILVVDRIVRRPGRPQPPSPVRSAALDELELRYARGEVSRDEYLQRRADLLGASGTTSSGSAPTA